MSEPRSRTNPRVLWLYGADAVGKSTIGWEAYSLLVERQARVAYLDTDYLSFCHPAPSDPAVLVAENLRAVWGVYQAHGVEQLVVSGIVVTPEDRARLTALIPAARFVFCRLTATPATVQRRILARREAEAATQNITLSAETRAELEEYGRRSVGFAELLARFALEDFALDRRAHATGSGRGGSSSVPRRVRSATKPLGRWRKTPVDRVALPVLGA